MATEGRPADGGVRGVPSGPGLTALLAARVGRGVGRLPSAPSRPARPLSRPARPVPSAARPLCRPARPGPLRPARPSPARPGPCRPARPGPSAARPGPAPPPARPVPAPLPPGPSRPLCRRPARAGPARPRHFLGTLLDSRRLMARKACGLATRKRKCYEKSVTSTPTSHSSHTNHTSTTPPIRPTSSPPRSRKPHRRRTPDPTPPRTPDPAPHRPAPTVPHPTDPAPARTMPPLCPPGSKGCIAFGGVLMGSGWRALMVHTPNPPGFACTTMSDDENPVRVEHRGAVDRDPRPPRGLGSRIRQSP